ncbi:2-amino-4-hydroxy-6-hydroxymethyldihydropteridine diphosphokinase [Vibrio sp. IB15]|uniref:2-amino-4-hydroxy-6-hydroxymethyldihydropteridine diphosphokinase n=1 Tax=Vibrio chagasii TaxID=170679 RepID=A0A7V7NVN6_9VIBR|nr:MULTISPECIES: 2-amino-4-hydroxy-6-hydroxymethyldihydropteridine diphosphokinase [Vibrio]KAB0481071.1 2-amino-4-hydroxy-6-hydroxymethyldihydropteridine diphosphokinase [Vibrio chagasii]MBJ2145629.1 2-amino-4-hydroxy-6-hydroxymethyldihydropteridine diphosphokinase [Vibrio sp. IB15]
MTIAYVGVGTNIDRDKHARVAWKELQSLGTNLKCSKIYHCEPVGFDSHPFYNFVIELDTPLSLTEFSQELRKIEYKWGRAQDAHKLQDRNLDLDIVLFGDEISESAPELPRSDIYKYPFVTQPLYDLCPARVIPQDGRTVSEIWQKMQQLDSLSVVDIKL